MLQVRDLTVRYGGFQALRGVDLEVDAGELVVLLGANGAGKSTLFRAISGLTPPAAGEISFAGRALTRAGPDAVVAAGIAHCPEARKLFPQLSVHKNLVLGGYVQRHDKPGQRAALAYVYELFPVLADKARSPAGALSGGQQQMVAIGRSLMARPRLLLLDEPSLGLAPRVTEQVLGAVSDINRNGTMVLLAEQNAHAALQIAHRGYVLETGRVAVSGGTEELLGNEAVRRAYIGA